MPNSDSQDPETYSMLLPHVSQQRGRNWGSGASAEPISSSWVESHHGQKAGVTYQFKLSCPCTFFKLWFYNSFNSVGKTSMKVKLDFLFCFIDVGPPRDPLLLAFIALFGTWTKTSLETQRRTNILSSRSWCVLVIWEEACLVHDVSNSFLRVSYFCQQNPIFGQRALRTCTMKKWSDP